LSFPKWLDNDYVSLGYGGGLGIGVFQNLENKFHIGIYGGAGYGYSSFYSHTFVNASYIDDGLYSNYSNIIYNRY